MRKRKNGERRVLRKILQLILRVTLGGLFALSIPSIYAFVTYYHVQYIESETTGWWIWSSLWSNTDELCVSVNRKGELVAQQLEYKLIIDDLVVPYYEINVRDGFSGSYDLFAPRVDDVCTIYTDLTMGEHEIMLLSYDVHTFQWILRHQSTVYVDNEGKITQMESVDA